MNYRCADASLSYSRRLKLERLETRTFPGGLMLGAELADDMGGLGRKATSAIESYQLGSTGIRSDVRAQPSSHAAIDLTLRPDRKFQHAANDRSTVQSVERTDDFQTLMKGARNPSKLSDHSHLQSSFNLLSGWGVNGQDIPNSSRVEPFIEVTPYTSASSSASGAPSPMSGGNGSGSGGHSSNSSFAERFSSDSDEPSHSPTIPTAPAGGNDNGGNDELPPAAICIPSADFNHDNTVDGADFLLWQTQAGATGENLAADANCDDVVDSLDLEFWKQHYGEQQAPSPPGEFNISMLPIAYDADLLTISWEASEGATSYEVILSQSPSSPPVYKEVVLGTSWTLGGVAGGTMSFSVIARNDAGETVAANSNLTTYLNRPTTPQVIFVTANKFLIDTEDYYPPFGGFFTSPAAADYQVTNLANLHGMIENWDGATIEYRAMLGSEFDIDLTSRANVGRAGFVNTRGELIAFERDELYSGVHLAQILTPAGNALEGHPPVWTGANPDGTASGLNADGWDNRFGMATVGRLNGVGSTWLSSETLSTYRTGAHFYGIGAWEGDFDEPPPTVVQPIVDQALAVGEVMTLDTSAAFEDAQVTKFKYFARQTSGMPLPSWLSIDESTGMLTGTPAASDVGSLTIEVAMMEVLDGETAIDQFEIVVTANA